VAIIMFPERNIFGTLPIKPLLLVKALKAKRWSNREQRHYPPTSELFNFLNWMRRSSVNATVTSKVATAKGIKPFHYSKNKKHTAFVLDYLWWSKAGGTLLAAESELSSPLDDMKHDFEKLLCWKAPFKLMILREHSKLTKDSAESISKALSKYARTNQPCAKHETFILFVFGKGGKCSAFYYVAQEDGTRKFDFKTLPDLVDGFPSRAV
jgi:hypothetical protein